MGWLAIFSTAEAEVLRLRVATGLSRPLEGGNDAESEPNRGIAEARCRGRRNEQVNGSHVEARDSEAEFGRPGSAP